MIEDRTSKECVECREYFWERNMKYLSKIGEFICLNCIHKIMSSKNSEEVKDKQKALEKEFGLKAEV